MSVYRMKRLSLHFWLRACAHDGVDPRRGRAQFSAGNPHAAASRRATALLARVWGGLPARGLPR
jgi:hypothetical protein